MTIQGAIYELNNMLSSNDISFYWKPAIKKIIETVEQNVGEISEQTDGDLISRQAVLDIFGDIHPLDYNARAYVKQIKELPSADIRRNRTDGNLISRESVITMLNKIENAVEDGDGFQFNEWIDYAKDIPSAEKTAEWIKQKSGDELFPEEIVCSKCYRSNSHFDFDEHNNPIGKVFFTSKYCPNCGARMKGVE